MLEKLRAISTQYHFRPLLEALITVFGFMLVEVGIAVFNYFSLTEIDPMDPKTFFTGLAFALHRVFWVAFAKAIPMMLLKLGLRPG